MEAVGHDHVLGREAELAEIRRSIDATPQGARGLVLEGSAGIGKTTLWQAGAEAAAAAGFQVLVTRAAESEATLSYAALGDLFEQVADDARPQLPDPQQRALDAALLRSGSDVSIPDRRAVLARRARRGPRHRRASAGGHRDRRRPVARHAVRRRARLRAAQVADRAGQRHRVPPRGVGGPDGSPRARPRARR